MSAVLGDMGLALIKVSKYEEEEGIDLTKAYDTSNSIEKVSSHF